MAKRIICIIFIFALCCSGCAVKPDGTAKPASTPSAMSQPSSSAATKPTIPAPTIPLRPYNDPPILNIAHVYHRNTPDKRISLDEEASAELISLLNELEWVRGTLKLTSHYLFECNGFTLGYVADHGVFIDEENCRSLELTQEQHVFVDQLLYEVFFADAQVKPIAPAGCGQYYVDLDDIGYSFVFSDMDCASGVTFASWSQGNYQTLKNKWENKVEHSIEPDQEAIIYQYTLGNGTNITVILYSFQTEEYTYIVYEEYYPDKSEEIPQYVTILGTNDSNYFCLKLTLPTKQITKDWISQWGIQNGLMTEITA